MELDEMKKAWERLDQRLDRQLKYSQKLFLDTQLTKARKGLRPLFWGQIVQVIFGVFVILFGVAAWTRHLGVIHLMIPGWIIHAYGVLSIISAGVVMGLIGKIDYSAPVAAIQTQLDRLRTVHIRTSLALGLSWWLLWIPFFLALFGFVGADIAVKAPSFVIISAAIGVVGIFASLLFLQWARHPSREAFAKRVEDSAGGSSLNYTSQVLEDIARVEKE